MPVPGRKRRLFDALAFVVAPLAAAALLLWLAAGGVRQAPAAAELQRRLLLGDALELELRAGGLAASAAGADDSTCAIADPAEVRALLAETAPAASADAALRPVRAALALAHGLEPEGATELRALPAAHPLRALWENPPAALSAAQARGAEAGLPAWLAARVLVQAVQRSPADAAAQAAAAAWCAAATAATAWPLVAALLITVAAGLLGLGFLALGPRALRRRPPAAAAPGLRTQAGDAARVGLVWFGGYLAFALFVAPHLPFKTAGSVLLSTLCVGAFGLVAIRVWGVQPGTPVLTALRDAGAPGGAGAGPLRVTLWAFGGCLAAMPVVVGLTLLSEALLGGRADAAQHVLLLAIVEPDPLAQLAILTSVGLVAPLFEELLFRGYLYPAVRATLGGPVAAALTAILFGFVHLDLAIFLPLVGLGLVLAAVRQGAGWPAAVACHALWNLGSAGRALLWLSSGTS